MEVVLLSAVFSFIAAGVGAYLGSYLKKKGENLATREDIDTLVEQVSAVTHTTKSIEAQISNEVWDRQRRWDVRKEAIFEAVRELASAQAALTNLMSTYAATHRPGLKDTDPNAELQKMSDSSMRVEAHAAYDKAHLSFSRATMLASITCGPDVTPKFRAVEKQMATMLADTMKTDKNPMEAFQLLPDLIGHVHALAQAVRAELGVDPAARPASESSGC